MIDFYDLLYAKSTPDKQVLADEKLNAWQVYIFFSRPDKWSWQVCSLVLKLSEIILFGPHTHTHTQNIITNGLDLNRLFVYWNCD